MELVRCAACNFVRLVLKPKQAKQRKCVCCGVCVCVCVCVCVLYVRVCVCVCGSSIDGCVSDLLQ